MTNRMGEVRVKREYDPDADHSYLNDEHRYDDCSPEDREKYLAADRERLAQLGETWNYIGIWAECEVIVNGVSQTLHSGGLWGIEDDSDKGYLQQIADEQVSELRGIVGSVGIEWTA